VALSPEVDDVAENGRAGRLSERVLEVLRSSAGRDQCIGCIAHAVGVPHKRAHDAMLKLEAHRGFTRSYGKCSICGKTRIVATIYPEPMRAVAPKTKTSSDAI
jgi:ribosomal protein L34E